MSKVSKRPNPDNKKTKKSTRGGLCLYVNVSFWAVGRVGRVLSKREAKMKEKELVKRISDYLRTVDNLFFWKEHGGQYGTAGIPDIIVCYKGRFLAFECKVGKNKTTVLQEVTIKQMIRAGGYAIVVRSVEEVKEVIEAFKKERG